MKQGCIIKRFKYNFIKLSGIHKNRYSNHDELVKAVVSFEAKLLNSKNNAI
jgi:hypothetical protein